MKKDCNISEMTVNRLNLSAWTDIQKSITQVTGLSIGLYNNRLQPVVKPVIDNKINNLALNTEKGKEIFDSFFKKTSELALSSKEPLIIRSPVNQYLFIIPVHINKRDPFFIIGGHCYANYDDFSCFIENAQDFGLSPGNITPLARDVIYRSHKTINSVAQFVHTTVRHTLLKYAPPQHQEPYANYKQKAVMGFITELSRSSTYKDMSEQVFQALCILFDVNSISIMVRKGDSLVTSYAFGTIERSISNITFNVDDPVIRDVFENKAPQFLETPYDFRKAGLNEDITSLSIFPLANGEKILGIITIFNTKFDKQDKEVLSDFIRVLSCIWEYVSMKDDYKKIKREFSIFTDIYATFASILEGKDLYDIILEKSTELINARHGSLMIRNTGTEELVGVAVKGINKKLAGYLKVRVGEGIAGKVCEKSTPLMVTNIENDPRIEKKNRPRYKTKSFISIPLKVGNRTIGVLNITDKNNGGVFCEEDLRLLQSFISYSSIALERLEFFKMSEDFKKIAITDHLTELLNRRYFQERLTEEIERSRRHGHTLSLIMIDIDCFKPFNDTRGHIAGDAALKTVSKILGKTVRSIDVVSRYGGDEFAVILPQTKKNRASIIGERIRAEVEQTAFPHKDMEEGDLTVSLGLASFPEDADDIMDFVNSADRAMYTAKARGKNRLCLYGQ